MTEGILDIIPHILSIKHNNSKEAPLSSYIYIGYSPYLYYYTITKLPKYRVLLTLLSAHAIDKLPEQDTPHRLYRDLANALAKFL